MANSGGGYIIVGVDEGRVAGEWNFNGLSNEDASSWEITTLHNIVQQYADPPVNCDVRVCHLDEGRFAVISVAPFSSTPHICKKSYQVTGQRDYVLRESAIYVRTGGAQSKAISTSEEIRALLEQSIRVRQDQIVEQMRSILKDGLPETAPSNSELISAQVGEALEGIRDDSIIDQLGGLYTIDIMYPENLERRQFNPSQLLTAARDASWYYDLYTYLMLGEGIEPIRTNDGYRMEHEGRSPLDDSRDYVYWSVHDSGLLVRKAILWEPARHSGRRFFDYDTGIKRNVRLIDFLARFYRNLGLIGERVTLRMTIEGTQDLPLGSVRGRQFYDNRVCHIGSISEEMTHTASEWLAGGADYAAQLSDEVLQRFGFDSMGARPFRAEVDEILRRGALRRR